MATEKSGPFANSFVLSVEQSRSAGVLLMVKVMASTAQPWGSPLDGELYGKSDFLTTPAPRGRDHTVLGTGKLDK